MKRILGVLLAVFLCSNVFAQGINFEHGTFAESLAKAKKENKMVFMDCYTTWCGPCKMLTKNIFPQEEVGTYFNEHFVAVKMDMEKGEGIELMKKYEVKAFPTLLFMDAEGKVLHKIVGGSDAAGLIAEAKIAMDPNQRIGALEDRYAKGDRDFKFVAKYVKALQKAYRNEDMVAVGKEFLSTAKPDQLLTEDGFTVMAYTGVEYAGKEYAFVLENKAKLIATEGIGEENFNYVVGGAIKSYLGGIAKTGTLEELETAIVKCKKDFTSADLVRMEDELHANFYLSNKQFDKWISSKEKSAEVAVATDKRIALSIYINTAYQISMDPIFENAGIYDEAIAMTLKAKKLDENFMGTFYCLATLYKKTGDKAKALENINFFLAKNAEKGGKSDARVDKLKAEIEAM